MVIFYKKWKKYNEIQSTKKKDLNIRKITNHPPSPEDVHLDYRKTAVGQKAVSDRAQSCGI